MFTQNRRPADVREGGVITVQGATAADIDERVDPIGCG
jgi:hypothetical protein